MSQKFLTDITGQNRDGVKAGCLFKKSRQTREKTMYTFTNLLAALFIFSMIPENSADISEDTATEQPAPQDSGYVVIESIDDNVVTIDTGNGTFTLPRNMLPSNINQEGFVIEWHISEEEHDKRMAQARSRIERMQQMSK